jgi:hypothetical protein
MLKAIGARSGNRETFELGDGGRVVIRKSKGVLEGIVAIVLERADQPPMTLAINPESPAAEPHPRIEGAKRSGSDGTRTRDLRRDRPAL